MSTTLPWADCPMTSNPRLQWTCSPGAAGIIVPDLWRIPDRMSCGDGSEWRKNHHRLAHPSPVISRPHPTSRTNELVRIHSNQSMKKKPPSKAVTKPETLNTGIALTICERIASGQSLRTICENSEMPARSTVHKWLSESESFRDFYGIARELQADELAGQVLQIADTATDAQLAKLRMDARIWYAGKVRPKKYGPRAEIENTGNAEKIFVTIGGNA